MSLENLMGKEKLETAVDLYDTKQGYISHFNDCLRQAFNSYVSSNFENRREAQIALADDTVVRMNAFREIYDKAVLLYSGKDSVTNTERASLEKNIQLLTGREKHRLVQTANEIKFLPSAELFVQATRDDRDQGRAYGTVRESASLMEPSCYQALVNWAFGSATDKFDVSKLMKVTAEKIFAKTMESVKRSLGELDIPIGHYA